jgi:hypothetical protein
MYNITFDKPFGYQASVALTQREMTRSPSITLPPQITAPTVTVNLPPLSTYATLSVPTQRDGVHVLDGSRNFSFNITTINGVKFEPVQEYFEVYIKILFLLK